MEKTSKMPVSTKLQRVQEVLTVAEKHGMPTLAEKAREEIQKLEDQDQNKK